MKQISRVWFIDMTLIDRPLSPRSNEIKHSEVPKYVRKLKTFLGRDALEKAQADLDKELVHHGRLYQYWVEQHRPWLVAFRLYDKITANGVHMPPQWPVTIQKLVGDGLMIASLHRGMPDDVRGKYRKDLLTRQHGDFMFEISTAWHYHREGFDIQWYPLGHNKCPEFRVRGGGLDFDVECRRFSLDVSEKIKTSTMADVCDGLHNVLVDNGVWGEVDVEFSDDFRFDPNHMPVWARALGSAVKKTQTTVQLDSSVMLNLDLKASPSRSHRPHEILALAKARQHPEVTFILSKLEGDSGLNPVVFRCHGPHKTPKELRAYIYNTLKDKVDMQLSLERAGVLVVKFSGVRNPQLFNESKGMRSAVARLFGRKHLAALVLHCDDVAEGVPGNVVHSTPANLFRNHETIFPRVAEARHLTR
ncbi:MAG TPA: hypothetical protein VFG71_11295 [Nitrospiraceae bacterium]|nr:hypothetical protein [Nitrospiraceae bacterium]